MKRWKSSEEGLAGRELARAQSCVYTQGQRVFRPTRLFAHTPRVDAKRWTRFPTIRPFLVPIIVNTFSRACRSLRTFWIFLSYFGRSNSSTATLLYANNTNIPSIRCQFISRGSRWNRTSPSFSTYNCR